MGYKDSRKILCALAAVRVYRCQNMLRFLTLVSAEDEVRRVTCEVAVGKEDRRCRSPMWYGHRTHGNVGWDSGRARTAHRTVFFGSLSANCRRALLLSDKLRAKGWRGRRDIKIEIRI